MKFDEASLTGYLVENLESLTEADPAILAKYVVALLKKDKPLNELQTLCTDNLVEFLGSGAYSFTSKLFEALEDDSIIKVDRTINITEEPEPFQATITEGVHMLKGQSSGEDNLSTSSDPSGDPEDKEVSDDDDDDRNHKHRRREAQPNSLESDTEENYVKRPNRKRTKPYDNGERFIDNNIQSDVVQKEYNPASRRSTTSKFDRRRSDFTPLLRAPSEPGTRSRFNAPLRNDLGLRFDFSTSVGRHAGGRGRGRSLGHWNQHDSRFNQPDTLDFASQLASQGPTHPNLFVGTGIPGVPSTHGSSWGGFGFIPAMPNGIMDPLNPLGLQSLGPAINPPLNLGIPRQRCRDFEERGFCLRGDMCPMEHGLNRIVVEDVQSLSQFNLPVSIPNSHLGIQGSTGPLPPVLPPSGQLTNTKSVSNKTSKLGAMDDATKLNDIPSSAATDADADIYDPDQPLWSNDHPDSSAALLRLASQNVDAEPSWDGDSSASQTFKSEGIESEVPSKRSASTNGPQNTNSSVWCRIGSTNKSEVGIKVANMPANSRPVNEEDNGGEAAHSSHASHQSRGGGTTDIGSKGITEQPFTKSKTDFGHKNARVFQKAFRTLYVNGIPQKSNRRDALVSHFQKFGEIINIYIPMNSERAFVQFSKREEAEAALRSPEAVMGNRFIRLSWANRDRISDDGQRSGSHMSVQSLSAPTLSVPLKRPVSNGGNETLSAAGQRRSNISAAEQSMQFDGPGKSFSSNATKIVPPVQKKLGSLELLEEIRRKQESLAKKREDFKRQLDNFAKQAVPSKKGAMIPEQVAKRQKVDGDSQASTTPRNLGQVAEKTLEKTKSEGVFISNGSNTSSITMPQPLRNASQTGSLTVSLPNKYKLDNRSTSFRILPPLPAGFANVHILKDHFSRYGVISSVVLEDPEHADNKNQTPSEKCSACITFATRHSAEKAYQTGKCWEGHNLQFKWLTVISSSSSDLGVQESSRLSPEVSPRAHIQGTSCAEKSTCSVTSSDVSVVEKIAPDGVSHGMSCTRSSQFKPPGVNSQFSSIPSLEKNAL